MKNSLLLNNFFHERPTTAHVKQDNGRGSRQSVNINIDLSASRQSVEFPTPRDTSSRQKSRMKSRVLQDSDRSSTYSQTLESDEDISISDLEDDYVDPRYNHKANNYWSNLDDSIKRINDDSDRFALKPRPNFKSSEVFKDVMSDMSGNVEYGLSKGYTLLKQKIRNLTNVTSMTAMALSQAKSNGHGEVESQDDDSDSDDDEIKAALKRENEQKELVSNVGGAKRAWRVLKTHVKETGFEQRTTNVKMNWEALRHHVSGISDLDRARQDLYQRYGFLPTLQEDGSKVCKNVMWLNRTRAQIIQKESDNILRGGKVRAQSARPFIAQNSERKLSANNYNSYKKRAVSCNISNGVSHLRVRPSSEKVTRHRLRPTSVKSKNTLMTKPNQLYMV